jgi:hypothetical protein
MITLLLTLLLQTGDNEIKMTADFAWGRYYRMGAVTPVRIVFDNPGGTFRGKLVLRWTGFTANPKKKFTLADLEGGESGFYETAVVLPEKSRQIHTLYVPAEHSPSEHLMAVLMADNAVVGYVDLAGNPVDLTSLFIGVVGTRQPTGLRQGWNPQAELGFIRPDELPDRWFGFSGLDALIWLDGDPGQLRDPAQEMALRRWVIQGGHLIVVRGKATGLQRTFLEELLPAEVLGDAQGEMTKLISLYGTRAPSGDADYLILKPKPGAQVLFSYQEHPIGIRGSVGRGQVTIVGIDFVREPFARWSGMTSVWRHLISKEALKTKDQNFVGTYTTDPGLFSLGSVRLIQLAQQFPGIEPPSMAWAFFLIVVFILLVGPVDYIVLRKLKRFELTWFTFPGLVIGFSAIALFGRGTYASENVLSRDMEIVDYYQDYELERGWSVVSVLSIDDASFTIESPRPDSTLTSLRSSTFALGQNYGQRSRSNLRGSINEKSSLTDWTIARGGQGLLSNEWCVPSKRGVAFEVQGKPPEILTLTIDNPNAEPILGAFLVHRDGMYSIGTIEPGKSLKRVTLSYRNWREGVQFSSTSQLPGVLDHWSDDYRYYEYNRVRWADAAQLDAGIRQILAGLSFHSGLREVRAVSATSQFTGMARDWDSTDYVDDGGYVLLGTLKRKGTLKFSPAVGSAGDQILIRTFHRHD